MLHKVIKCSKYISSLKIMKLQLSTLRSFRTPIHYSDYNLRYFLDFSVFFPFRRLLVQSSACFDKPQHVHLVEIRRLSTSLPSYLPGKLSKGYLNLFWLPKKEGKELQEEEGKKFLKRKKKGGGHKPVTISMSCSLAPCLKFRSGRTRTSVTSLLMPLWQGEDIVTLRPLHVPVKRVSCSYTQ